MMKRKILFIFIFLFCFFLIGCNEDVKENDDNKKIEELNLTISNLPDLNEVDDYLSYEEEVKGIVDKYNLLTKEEQSLVNNYDKVLEYNNYISGSNSLIEDIIIPGETITPIIPEDGFDKIYPIDPLPNDEGNYIITYQYDYGNGVSLDKYDRVVIKENKLYLYEKEGGYEFDIVVSESESTLIKRIFDKLGINISGNLYALQSSGAVKGYYIGTDEYKALIIDTILIEFKYDELAELTVIPSSLFKNFTVDNNEEALDFNYYSSTNEFYNEVSKVKLEFVKRYKEEIYNNSDYGYKVEPGLLLYDYAVYSPNKNIYITKNNLIIFDKNTLFTYEYNIVEGDFNFIEKYYKDYSLELDKDKVSENGIIINCKEDSNYQYKGATITEKEVIGEFIEKLNNIKLRQYRGDLYRIYVEYPELYFSSSSVITLYPIYLTPDYTIDLGLEVIYIRGDVLEVHNKTVSSIKFESYHINRDDIAFIEDYIIKVENNKVINNEYVTLVLDTYLGEDSFILNSYEDLNILEDSYKDIVINAIMRDSNLDKNIFDTFAIVYVNFKIPKGTSFDGIYYDLMEYNNKYLEVIFDVDYNNGYGYVYEEDCNLPFIIFFPKYNIEDKFNDLELKVKVRNELLDYELYYGLNKGSSLKENFLVRDSYDNFEIINYVNNKIYNESNSNNISNKIRNKLIGIDYYYVTGSGYSNKSLDDFNVIRSISLNNGEIYLEIIDDKTFLYNGALCEVFSNSYYDFSFLDDYFEFDVYRVKLDSNGGSEVPEFVETNYLGALELPYPEKDGYLFAGWFTDYGKQIGSSVYKGEEITLTAKWVNENDWIIETGDSSFNTIIKYVGTDKVIYMPIYKDGYKINIVEENCFIDNNYIETVYAPLGMNFRDKSFNNCDNFKEFYIGESIGGISGNIFYGCDNLESIVVDENNRTYSGRNVIYNKLMGQVVRAIKTTDLSELDVRSIGRYAFTDLTGLKSVVIPESCTSISMCAFSDCVDLESVIIYGRIDKLDYSTFRGCKSLKEVILPDCLVELDDFVFTGCSSLKEIIIPGSVKAVGHYTFKDCYSLEILTLEEGCTSLGLYTLHNCSSLLVLNLPSTLSYIGANVFQGCNNIKTININGNKTFKMVDNVLVQGSKVIYTIGNKISTNNNVCALNDYAYYYNLDLTEIEIPSNIKVINTGVFNNCRNLERVTLNEGLIQIGSYAFANCHKLIEIVIPEGVTSIGYGAFVGSGLTKIYLPKSLSDLNKNAFLSLQGLEIIVDGENPYYKMVDGVLVDTRTNQNALV